MVTDELGNDSIAIRPMTYLCMSWDHRALDGALAAQFLAGAGELADSSWQEPGGRRLTPERQLVGDGWSWLG